MAEIALAAEIRGSKGSPASRRLRTSGKIPGVLYGHGIEPTPLAVESRSLRLALNTEAGLNALIQLEVDGKKHLALPRAIQRHPVRNTVAHIDFQVVRRDEVMNVDVPIHFTGEADGVVKQGGVVEQILTSLAVQATPGNIPGHIEIDITELEMEGAIRVKDVKLPKDVTTELDPEEVIVTGKASRAAAAIESDDEAAAAEASAESSAGQADAASDSTES